MGQYHAELAAAAALLLTAASCSSPPRSSLAPAASLQLWYWHHSNLTTDAAVAASERLIDRAARCGYTGLAFWDNSFVFLADTSWRANTARLRAVIDYATAKGMKVMGSGAPFGWSNGALTSNGNMAEGQRVLGAPFMVAANGRELQFVNDMPPLRNGGFEEGRTEWFDTGDAAIGLTPTAHQGRQAAVVVDARANARFRQKISLTPWRQYHISVWFRSKDFRGPAVLEILDWWHRSVSRLYVEIDARGTHDWTRLDYTFDSQDTRWAYLLFGVWGQSDGILSFDDVQIEATAPVYVVRRPGAPLALYAAGDRSTLYEEGRDFEPISDPVLSAKRAVLRDSYHTPSPVRLPAGTRLRPGQRVAMDYYAGFPMPKDEQMSMCLTDPAVFHWIEANAQATQTVLRKGDSVLLGYDEIRQGNSCASCRAKKMSAGELLAWNVQRVAELYQDLLPDAPLYVWSDMFDPMHNAHLNYYYVEGDLAGSWSGLPSRIGVLNWNHPRLRESLQWFSGMDRKQQTQHRQIIAGYYDSGRGESARADFGAAKGIPGVDGIMYVTWKDDYTQLETFARAAHQGWAAYLKSLASRSN